MLIPITIATRYKLSIVAGDDTGETNFIMFGRWVQRLTKKSADILIAENPRDFIPNEITALLEKTFIWNVSFTENTTGSSKVCFQVNAIVGEKDNADRHLSIPPADSQSSSLMLSQETSSSLQDTPHKSPASILPSAPVTAQIHKGTKKDEVNYICL